MKTTKMNLANVQGKLSRTEMKNIMAGNPPVGADKCTCNSADDCTEWNELCMASSTCDNSSGKAGMCGCIS